MHDVILKLLNYSIKSYEYIRVYMYRNKMAKRNCAWGCGRGGARNDRRGKVKDCACERGGWGGGGGGSENVRVGGGVGKGEGGEGTLIRVTARRTDKASEVSTCTTSPALPFLSSA